MHNSALLVTKENKIRIRHLGILRQKVRLWVELSQFGQNHRVTVAPSNVPWFVTFPKVLGHTEHVFERLEAGFEMQILTVLVKTVQGRLMPVVEILQESEVEQLCCWPMGYGIFNDNRT